MGWLKGRKPSQNYVVQAPPLHKEANGAQHIEYVTEIRNEEELPFMTAGEISDSAAVWKSDTTNEAKRLLLVVDDLVYDCTDFVKEHPGGETVIESFVGRDCSWQFWRFHSQRIMSEWSDELRIAKTSGVTNPYKEPKRYVGLRKFGNDEWD